MSECTHDCSSCGSSCGERTEPQSLLQPLNSASRVGKVIAVVSGQGGRLFGSVTAKEIAQEIKKQYGFDIDKRKIHLDTDIKAFGGYHIEVKLYNGITAKLAVSVTEAQ